MPSIAKIIETLRKDNKNKVIRLETVTLVPDTEITTDEYGKVTVTIEDWRLVTIRVIKKREDDSWTQETLTYAVEDYLQESEAAHLLT